MSSIDRIIGIAVLPISIIIFCGVFGIWDAQEIVSISILLVGSIALIVAQIANIMSSHIEKEYLQLSYITSIILMIPAFLYIASMFIELSETILTPLPAIIASFIFIEGIYSFYL